jgi:hypothetical protein
MAEPASQHSMQEVATASAVVGMAGKVVSAPYVVSFAQTVMVAGVIAVSRSNALSLLRAAQKSRCSKEAAAR